jgi:hypothetical protein
MMAGYDLAGYDSEKQIITLAMMRERRGFTGDDPYVSIEVLREMLTPAQRLRLAYELCRPAKPDLKRLRNPGTGG